MNANLSFYFFTFDPKSRTEFTRHVRFFNFVTVNEIVGGLVLVSLDSDDVLYFVFFPFYVDGLTDIMARFHLFYF